MNCVKSWSYRNSSLYVTEVSDYAEGIYTR